MIPFRVSSVLILFAYLALPLHAQESRRDQLKVREVTDPVLDSVKAETRRIQDKAKPPKLQAKMDFSKINAPQAVSAFTSVWHQPPVLQGNSGMCWCFSATSFFESEIHRLTQRKLKISELHTIYWEYVEKARRFVRERGDSEFGQGSESNAVPRIWRQYGALPGAAYTGLLHGRVHHDHGPMYDEMKAYLSSVESDNAWDEERVVATIRTIMDHHIGKPPERVTVDGVLMTPKEYVEKIIRLPLHEYVDFLSFMELPYFSRAEFQVPDNWWHDSSYHNIPLDAFTAIIRRAVRSGYSVCIGGDISEPGIAGEAGVAVVPTFDIPSAYIDEDARNFRFRNGTTQDDHGVHLIGFEEQDGKDWYLIKDSWSIPHNNRTHPGYYFFHEDYVKLKMLSFMVHRDMATEVLKRFSR